jgi:peptide/nickel transport system substrate-binding protein
MQRSITRRTFAGLLGITGAAALSACGSSEQSASGTTLTIGSTVLPQSWDPALIGDSNYVPYAQAVYDSLIRRTTEDEYVPMLASSWELAEDGMSMTLTLQEGITFHDGTPLDAAAVVANLEHFATSAGPLGTQLARFGGAEVLSDLELRIDFTEPEPDILYNLSDAAGRIAGPEALGTEELKIMPVGSGPYVMDPEATIQGYRFVLRAREDYWAPELQQFDTVVLQIFSDETGLLNALLSEQVDVGNLSSQDNIQNARVSGIEIMQPDVHMAWAGLAIFDREGSIVPELASAEVRRAIAHAIDGKKVLEAAYLGEGEPTAQIFLESSPAYDTALNDTYAFDPELARELLESAGHGDGFVLPMPAATGFLSPAVQGGIEQYLGDVGIEVQWDTIPSQQLYSDLGAGKYAASFVYYGNPTDWACVQSYLVPGAAWNPMGTEDPELQALIDAIPAATEADREQLFAEINRWVLDAAWFVPWFWLEENFAVASDSITVQLQPRNNVPFLYNYAPAR